MARSDDLVEVNGVTPNCRTGPLATNPTGTLYLTPQLGYCHGVIKTGCLTGKSSPSGPPGVGGRASIVYEKIPVACEGTFTLLAEIEAEGAQNLRDVLKVLQQQMDLFEKAITLLSNSNDALTKRLNDLEDKINK
jgi:hypothetical protein